MKPLILVLLLLFSACTPREQTSDESAPAPVDTFDIDSSDTALDTLAPDTVAGPDTGVATPPITPPQSAAPQDTPPAGAQPSTEGAGGQQVKLSQAEYEGWRQYSVNCARCHGQDVLPNPVAANLLISVAPGGPMASPGRFTQVVSEGRPERGMPAFKSILTQEQTQAIYAYVKGRAEKRIPPGRPAEPTS
jgi:mono/diheme cytochrome c family protein